MSTEASSQLIQASQAQVEALGAPAVINLDANANAAPTEEIIAAVHEALRESSNPSSAHQGGDMARTALEAARDAVAALVHGAYPENVAFTSGCTEANNQVIWSAHRFGAAIVLSAVEHPSVTKAAEAAQRAGSEVHVVPVGSSGVLDLEQLSNRLASLTGPAFVSVQAANSETGVLQPLTEISRLVRSRSQTWLHSDAAQAFGKIPLRVGRDGVDVLTVSGHKLHAPMGVGALIRDEGVDVIAPMLFGGDQEGGLRAGTQASPLIAGFAAACIARYRRLDADLELMARLRDKLEQALLAALPEAWVNGLDEARLPNTTNMGFKGVDSTTLVGVLDADGVFASQGSACHSRRPEASPVLRAMGLSETEAYSSIRFSVSPLNTISEIEAAIPTIVSACQRLGIRA